MPEAVIVDVVRTPIGRAFKGSLKDVRAEDLGAFAVKTLMEKVPEVDGKDVQDLMLGCAFGEGEQGYNAARQVGLLSGLPVDVGATTVNRFCASSLQTIRMAFHAIKAGEGDTYVAAGLEAVSRASGGGNFAFHPKLHGEGAIYDAYIPMGMTAENVADEYNVTREQMDEYAARSQQLAVESQENGFFDRELTPYTLEDGTVVSKDDGPRAGTTVEKLAELQPAFRPEGGRVTAGNACPLNDGAAAALVMSEDRAKELGLKPRARIVASSVSGLAPEMMGVGPIVAIQRVLDLAGMTIDDIDIVELNEAFAAQVIPIMDAHNIPLEKLNPHGGAIALGHPFGMTGARIMATLLNGLETDDKTVGLETMCVGGGQGMAMIVERLN